MIRVTKPVRFRQSDVTRFFKGAEKAGVQLSRVEIDPTSGRMIATIGTVIAGQVQGASNEWDEVLH